MPVKGTNISCFIAISLSLFLEGGTNITFKDENGTETSRTEPHRFLYLIRSNSHFLVRLYRFRFRFHISNVKVENGLNIFRPFLTFLFLI
jgi:hypothetical protein